MITMAEPTWNLFNLVGRRFPGQNWRLLSNGKDIRFRSQRDLFRCGDPIYHKACYGALILNDEKKRTRGGTKHLDTFNNCITMSTYFERYERERRQKIEAYDRRLLMGLTGNILFCEHCFRPFLVTKRKKELISAFGAMMDYVSAILFVVVPVAWILLALLFLVIWLFQKVKGLFYGENAAATDSEGSTDYNKQYIPRYIYNKQYNRLQSVR